ncbi:histidine phosphatase family protein [Pseudohongiella nitratireducens]|uniref:Histidine phosphatase family protein n=1 Tax=Pseudohongiella nitratireducens TaxID=1768907 RepID=A0A917LQH7_9GAMM|nr:histidine phosphatase family protein [Pseudohongiella nitratireducens]GGG51959.1 histidine phosphatase family protein [Pseudohongiella nitratireducens]
MSELILVRHGQASFGQDNYDKLSEQGCQQVTCLAKHWEKLGDRFDAIYSGTLQRQQETAEILLPNIADQITHIHPGLNEYNADALLNIYWRDHAANDGMAQERASVRNDRKAFQRTLEKTCERWIKGKLEANDSDTTFESWRTYRYRVMSALEEIMQTHTSGSRVVLSTSGGVIAVALQRALSLPDEQVIACNWMIHNSSVTRLVYSGSRVSMGAFNNLAHLDTPQLRSLITFR